MPENPFMWIEAAYAGFWQSLPDWLQYVLGAAVVYVLLLLLLLLLYKEITWLDRRRRTKVEQSHIVTPAEEDQPGEMEDVLTTSSEPCDEHKLNEDERARALAWMNRHAEKLALDAQMKKQMAGEK